MVDETSTETQELTDLAATWRAAGAERIAARIVEAVRGWNPVAAMRVRWFLQGLIDAAEHRQTPTAGSGVLAREAAALRQTRTWLRHHSG